LKKDIFLNGQKRPIKSSKVKNVENPTIPHAKKGTLTLTTKCGNLL